MSTLHDVDRDLDFLHKEGINGKTIEIYARYYKSCIVKNKSTRSTTYKSYAQRAGQFFKFIRDHYQNKYIFDESIITSTRFIDVYEDYLASLIIAGNNNQTIRNKRTAVSVFFDWCERREYLTTNPFRRIEHAKITEEDAVRKDYFLAPQDIWKINYVMETCPKKFDIQDKIIFNLFLDSAIRISAGHSLKISQLDLHNNCFLDIRHKEGYIRNVYFRDQTKKLIQMWLLQREQESQDTTDHLLITRYGGIYRQMSKETIRARVRKMGKIVGIEDLYPHSIRKTIVSLVAQNLSLEEACEFAMHKNIKTTRDCYVKRKNRLDTISKINDFRNRVGI